jgi:hypothetical protein
MRKRVCALLVAAGLGSNVAVSWAQPRAVGQTLAKDGELTVSKGLPEEVVRRHVRQQLPRMRSCYQAGLNGNPAMPGGTILVSFTIDRAGEVKDAKEAGGDFKDAAVRECVVRVFASMTFPVPDGATVSVEQAIVMEAPEREAGTPAPSARATASSSAAPSASAAPAAGEKKSCAGCTVSTRTDRLSLVVAALPLLLAAARRRRR